MFSNYHSSIESKKTSHVSQNLQSKRKSKRFCGNTQFAFKNTIVLAPFHALKQSFQEKLRDIYGKGQAENPSRKASIPDATLFQYEAQELKAGETSAKKGCNAANHEKQLGEGTQGKKKSPRLESEYCHCNKRRKRSGDENVRQEKSGDGRKNAKTANETIGSSANATREIVPDEPLLKKTRTDIQRNSRQNRCHKTTRTRKKVRRTKKSQKTKKLSSLTKRPAGNIESGTNRRKSEDTPPENKEDPQLDNVTIRSQRQAPTKRVRRMFERYQTRSVTRKEALHDAEERLPKIEEQKGSRNSPKIIKELRNTEFSSAWPPNPEVEICKSQKGLNGLEVASPKLSSPINSDLSVFIVGDVRLNDNKTIIVGSEDEGCTCLENGQSSKHEESMTTVSEVTKMSGTLLKDQRNEARKSMEYKSKETSSQKSENVRNPTQSCSQADNLPPDTSRRKSKQTSSDYHLGTIPPAEEQAGTFTPATIEPNIIIQHSLCESSSSDHMSYKPRKTDECGTVSDTCMYETNLTAYDSKVNKSSTYIFGPKNPYEQLRESCEYGFGMRQAFSDDDTSETIKNLESEKHK